MIPTGFIFMVIYLQGIFMFHLLLSTFVFYPAKVIMNIGLIGWETQRRQLPVEHKKSKKTYAPKKACGARISETRHLMPERENMHGLDVKSDTYIHYTHFRMHCARRFTKQIFWLYENWIVKERILFTLVSWHPFSSTTIIWKKTPRLQVGCDKSWSFILPLFTLFMWTVFKGLVWQRSSYSKSWGGFE